MRLILVIALCPIFILLIFFACDIDLYTTFGFRKSVLIIFMHMLFGAAILKAKQLDKTRKNSTETRKNKPQ